jgi:predicted transcriptional regulator
VDEFGAEGEAMKTSAAMKKTEIRVENVGAFFERGREYAKLADRGEAIPASRIIAFEEIGSMMHVLTEKRVLLLKEIKQSSGSISDLARKLKRDRSAVTRDVQLPESFGVVRVTVKPLPGHGTQKIVTPVAREIRITAEL